MDSRGVAHILEHTALCGSDKYPVRDPFFMMIRRSLNTFMNAFTSSDWTAYPFASKNRKDFDNLLNVYLDATFFSRLDELDFAQEGHRVEFKTEGDTSSELEFKGVVFNEMKGAMSSTNAVLWQTLSKYLFPGTTYHYNSGGEPDHIPDLSYQQLKDFYSSHYHPSNSVFMTFGDIPAHQHHESFETLALSKFEHLDIHIAVEDEKRYLSPIKVEESYASDDEEDKNHVVNAWLLGKSTDLIDLFKAQLLSSVLLDNSASPLLKVLETTKLGSSPSPICGLEDSNREMSFIAGLEGCDADSTAAVEALLMATLQDIADNGVPQSQIEASLHQLELSQREISGDGYPYGLHLILAGLSTAVHRGDPIQLLNVDAVLDQLRELIKDRQFIPNLVRELLLDNPHRVTLTLKPDLQIASRQLDAETQRLAEIKASMSAQQLELVVSQSKALAERQAVEDDPGLLPKVGLEDVPETMEEPNKITAALNSKTPISFYGQGTNGICYQQLILELPHLDKAELEALPLFSSCVPELGIGNKDYTQVQGWQASISGGINCFTSIRSDIDDVQRTKAILTLSSKALQSNHLQLSELLASTFHDCRFDEAQRIKEIIDQICSRKESSITAQGHSLAVTLASSGMSPTAKLNHQFTGLESIKQMKELRKRLNDGDAMDSLISSFKNIHALIQDAPKQFLLIGEQESQPQLIEELSASWQQLSQSSSTSNLILEPSRSSIRQAWTTSTQVSFCAKAYPTVASSHPDNAVLHVLAGFMRNGFLHRAIREQGGAYGGGASQDSGSASFRFFSYRDPRLDETLDDFDRAIDWVINKPHPSNQLEEAILGVIASMDKPSSPAGEAKQAFYNSLFGRTLEQRMIFRSQILAVTEADLIRVSEQYFNPEKASIGIVTHREALDKSKIGDLTEIKL